MKKKAIVNLSIVFILVAAIIGNTVLISKKPSTEHINKAQKLAEYTTPSVVRIWSYAQVGWVLSTDYTYEQSVIDFVNYINSGNNLVGGSGSGAFISGNGYIVTNAHVVEISKSDDQTIADKSFDQICQLASQYFGITYNDAFIFFIDKLFYQDVNKYLKVVLPDGEFGENGYTFDGEIKSYGAPVGEGKDVAVIKIEGRNFPTILMGDSDSVQIQDNVWAFGFPGAADLSTSVLSSESAQVVSITEGNISAVDKKSTQGAPVLQISSAVAPGSSGGPVIQEDGSVIGMVTFSKGVQGFSFIVPSNTMSEFISQSGAKNEQGQVDKLYREGLELYWGGYYNDALEKFEDVRRLFPQHSEVDEFIVKAQEKSSESKILWSKYKRGFFIFDGLAVAAIAFLLIRTFKGKPKDDEPKNMDKSEASASGSVKDDLDYDMLRRQGINPEELKDLNDNGKVDMEDVLIELQKKAGKDEDKLE